MKKIFLISFCIFGFSFEMLIGQYDGAKQKSDKSYEFTASADGNIYLAEVKKSNNPLASDDSTLVIKSKGGKDDQSKSDKKKNSKKKTE